MNKAINLAPEALKLVNSLCDASTLEEHVGNLEVAEDTLQDIAYAESESDKSAELFSVAYNIKQLRKDLIKLKKSLDNGREE